MDYNELKQFTFEQIDKLAASGIESIAIEHEQTKIQLSKQSSGAAAEVKINTKAVEAAIETISSPMVGTFYSAPSPDEEPFVTIGDKICKGDTICIIEAMKLMNEIEADKSGTVKEILIENGSIVEFGQPIMVIE